MRGETAPDYWDDRLEKIPQKDNWPQEWLEYERNLGIQSDFEWLVEAVQDLYLKHLTNLILENSTMWGDFCKHVKDAHTGRDSKLLDLDSTGYLPGDHIPVCRETVQPDPERHFAFSTRLMLFAIQKY